MKTQLTGVPNHKVRDAVLRSNALIHAIVTGEDHIHLVIFQDGLDPRAQVHIGAVKLPIEMQRW